MELAAIGHVDPGTLLGGLCELATLLTDPERVARWKVLGDAKLEAYRRRKAHRRRRESSGDGGTCAERNETVQA